MEPSAENDAWLDAVAACRFCVIGERGPLLCHQHARVIPPARGAE